MVQGIVSRLLKSPEERQARTLPAPVVQSGLRQTKQGVELLKLIGFRRHKGDTDVEAKYVMPSFVKLSVAEAVHTIMQRYNIPNPNEI